MARDAAQAAFEEENPLTAELVLFRTRWSFLDELAAETFMTLDNLVVYLLKLRLLESRAALSIDAGRQALSDLRRAAETEVPEGVLTPTTS